MSFHLNVEVKAKSNQIAKVREYLKAHATKILGTDHQVDTYFESQYGRLKLREGNIENALILYQRENSKGPKQSDVNLVKLEPKSGMKDLLRKANSIKVVVSKKREIYFINNVKFHLDQVEGLGEFVEIEAIDFNNDLGFDKLKTQCDEYINKFEIKESDFINCSYSDLIQELSLKFRDKIKFEFELFMKDLKDQQIKANLNTESLRIDHVCFRVKSQDEYNEFKNNLHLIGELLIESKIGGRDISTFRLFNPLIFNSHKISIVELPSPKIGSDYKTGFEHAEYIINESFESFAQRQPNIKFDFSGTHKKINPDLRYKFHQDLSIKFHHQSLEEIIEYEKQVN